MPALMQEPLASGLRTLQAFNVGARGLVQVLSSGLNLR